MRYFDDTDGLLQLFGIDCEKKGANEFAMLCDLMALMQHFPQYGVTVSDMAAASQKRLKWSAKVYWSTMKRAIKPLMDADGETLRALGVHIRADEKNRTCPELALAVADSLAGSWGPDQIDDEAAEVAAEIAVTCRRAK